MEIIIASDLMERLRGLGYSILGKAATAQQALDALEKERPDMVLMDIVLAGEKDGIDTAEIIRDRWDLPRGVSDGPMPMRGVWKGPKESGHTGTFSNRSRTRT